MSNDLTVGRITPLSETNSKDVGHPRPEPASRIDFVMSPQCHANGCFVASVNARELMRAAAAGRMITADKQMSAAYSLCRSMKEGDCPCSMRAGMPCPSLVSAIKYMTEQLIPAVLAAHGITEAHLRAGS